MSHLLSSSFFPFAVLRCCWLGLIFLVLSCHPTPAETPADPKSQGEVESLPPQKNEGPGFRVVGQDNTESQPVSRAFRVGPVFRIVKDAALVFALPQQIEEEKLSRLVLKASRPLVYGQLDVHSPRLLDRELRIYDLISEDEEVSVGVHRLSFFSEDGETLRFFEHLIFVGKARIEKKAEPSCSLFLPFGTYNGKATKEVRAIAVSSEPNVDTVQYRASQSQKTAIDEKLDRWRVEGSFPLGSSVLLPEPPDGDILVEAFCLAKNEVVGQVERIITLNYELGEPRK